MNEQDRSNQIKKRRSGDWERRIIGLVLLAYIISTVYSWDRIMRAQPAEPGGGSQAALGAIARETLLAFADNVIAVLTDPAGLLLTAAIISSVFVIPLIIKRQKNSGGPTNG